MKEPKRIDSIDGLLTEFAYQLRLILSEMQRLGWDPEVIETTRTQERQDWLYSIGRRAKRGEVPVTWTRHSLHQDGFAADVISRTRGYDAPEFYKALSKVAVSHQCRTLPWDKCHVQLDC